jgi:hypothetical protein
MIDVLPRKPLCFRSVPIANGGDDLEMFAVRQFNAAGQDKGRVTQ